MNPTVPEDLFTARPALADGGAAAAAVTESTVRGEILRVVFASADGQYVVLRLLDEHRREQVLVGAMSGVMEGQDIEAVGRWETHKEHGRQLRVTSFRAILPSTEEGIRRYLASGLIPGIGPTYAERIVDKFGTDTLTVLDKYSERLREVPGIGVKRIAEIRKAWQRHRSQREIVIFLQGLGIGPAFCARIIARYAAAAAEVVRLNPYRLAAEVKGIGFLTADRIASRLGVEKGNPLRLAAGVEYVLDQLALSGHVCYPEAELRAEAAKVLDAAESEVEDGLRRSLQSGRVVCEATAQAGSDRMVYHRRLHQSEVELAEAVTILLAASVRAQRPPVERLGKQYAQLNAEQRQAVDHAFRMPVSIITGGPGVGKTTVVASIVAAARALRLRILLAAPTGRAAKRLTEATGLEAMTIHRLLRWDAATAAFQHNPDHPLPCHLLVVDEVSMLDVQLAAHLFRAVRPGTAVVLVGDRDQLPSVGPGTVLHDLIACGRIPATNLTRIYRQEAGSRIVTNAHAVNQGRMPDLRQVPSGVNADFYWIEQDEPERAAEVIARLVAERIPKRFGLDPMADVQVLSPMHRGTCGAMALNELLQQALNPPGNRPEFAVGERRFRSGDRVMQTVNNYDKGVFNGELGRIGAIDFRQRTFAIDFDVGRVEYEWCDADQIMLAYAVTVHKSQGCEFAAVVMPLLTQHYVMLQRNLVYTAMTRAKRLLVMVGTKRAMGIALGNNTPMLRHTRLAARLATPAHPPLPSTDGLGASPGR